MMSFKLFELFVDVATCILAIRIVFIFCEGRVTLREIEMKQKELEDRINKL